LKSRTDSVLLSGLVLNEKGLERGLACGVELFCMGVSASETHSIKNTGMSRSEALERILRIADIVQQEGFPLQVSIQSAFGCGYEGPIKLSRVLEIVDRYLNQGLTNISFADTAGHADPRSVSNLFQSVFGLSREIECTCHFHDTYGLSLANCMAAIDSGVLSFESSVAGLGGCPFTATAGGNVCTEDLVHLFRRIGFCSSIDLEKLTETAREMADFFQRDLPGRVYKSGPIPA
jgi:hydroxymethylglutaryl-CoA lyase